MDGLGTGDLVMAELLVFATDGIGDDVYKNAKLPKIGHVIHVAEDGWNWGLEELGNVIFRIIKVPGATVETFQHLLSWEQPTVPLPPNESGASLTNTLQHRGFRVDPTLLPPVVRTHFTEGERPGESVTVEDENIILNAVVMVPPIDDPASIG
jgi:hypothetical protein